MSYLITKIAKSNRGALALDMFREAGSWSQAALATTLNLTFVAHLKNNDPKTLTQALAYALGD